MEVRPVVFRVHAAHQAGVGCETQALRHVDERLLLDVWTYNRTQARSYSDIDLDFLSLGPDLPRTSLDFAVRLSLSHRPCLEYSNLVQ
jgi:hypothetical protein